MDFDTLSKLRKPEIPKSKPAVNPPISSFIMQPEAIMVPAPPASVASAVSNHSGRVSMTDNFSTKSMSISDGEIEQPKAVPTGKVGIRSFSSSSGRPYSSSSSLFVNFSSCYDRRLQV